MTFEDFRNLSARLRVNGHMKQNPAGSSLWIRVSIPLGVGLFLFALAGSAFLVPQLRVLHVLQALIYVAILVLAGRNSPWGFGIGVMVPTAWNCLNLFVTHLFQKGAVQFWSLAHTGHVGQRGPMLVLVGGVAHLLLIIACLTAFLQQGPGERQWGKFLGGGFLALGYLVLIIAIARPR